MLGLTCEAAVDELDERPLASPEYLGGEQYGQTPANTAQESVDHGPGHHLTVPLTRDPGLGAAVEGEEAEDEDEGPEADEGDGVARHGKVLATGSEPPDPGAEHDGPHQGAGPSGQVDHAGPREVVELPEQEMFSFLSRLLSVTCCRASRPQTTPSESETSSLERRGLTVRPHLYWVHDPSDQHGEDNVAVEVASLRDGSRHNCCAGRSKCTLKHWRERSD